MLCTCVGGGGKVLHIKPKDYKLNISFEYTNVHFTSCTQTQMYTYNLCMKQPPFVPPCFTKRPKKTSSWVMTPNIIMYTNV